MKALLFVSVLWAFSFGLIKGQLTGVDPTLVAAIRLLLCALVFLPFIKFSTNNSYSLKLLGLGAVQFGVMYWAYIQSYQYLPGYLVAVFTIFTPIYVFLVASIWQRNWQFSSLVPIFISIVGAATIVYRAPEANQWLTGFLILQCANIAFALGQVGYKYLSQSIDAGHTNSMAIMYMGAAIFSVITVLFTGSYSGIPDITKDQWLVLLYLGVIASGIGFAAWNYGAKQVKASTLGLMNNGYIPFAVIFSITLFGEQADIVRLTIGTSLMLVAAYWLEKRNAT
ncbi:EamA family transporter [Thalassotalea euphylliae]|uniref:EamA family transporter n=1 Tax=Thalassotalea euphylliae TaxID=1655234 RepID=UPI00362E9406